MEILWWILTILLFVLGFLGLVVPVLPDAPLFFLGLLIYHFLIDSEALGTSFWVGAVLITALVVITDYVAGGIAARTYGGSRWSLPAAVVGALAGIPLGPLGLVLGPVVAVIAVEFFRKKDWQEAFRVGFGTLLGFVGGVLVKGLMMVGLLIWFLILAL